MDSDVNYSIRKGSIYWIMETNFGINILWNQKNTVKVQLEPQHMGTVKYRLLLYYINDIIKY